MEVLRGVLVSRIVTAAHVAALHAQPQVHPGITCLQAVLAAVRAGPDSVNVVEMGAFGQQFTSNRPPFMVACLRLQIARGSMKAEACLQCGAGGSIYGEAAFTC